MPRIACLHTAHSNIAVFEAAGAALGPDAGLRLGHDVRPDLLAAAEQAGGLTAEIAERAAAALQALSREADAVLLTCSTLGPAVAGVDAPVPVLRADAALAREAVRDGGRVVALCAVETTLAPTRELFEAAAAATGAAIEVRLVAGAWAAFRAGDAARYLRLVAAAADAAMRDGARRVALAQASMAGAAALVRSGRPPLTSPAAALAEAIARAGPGAPVTPPR